MRKTLAIAAGIVLTALGAAAPAYASTPRTYVLYPTLSGWHWTYKPAGFYVQPVDPGFGSNFRLRYIHWTAYSRFSAEGTARVMSCRSTNGTPGGTRCRSFGRHKFHLYRMRSQIFNQIGRLHYFTRLYVYGAMTHPWSLPNAFRWSFKYATWVQN